MTKAADDFEAIRRRMEELSADKQQALTGSTTKDKPMVFPDYYGISTQAGYDPEYLCTWQNE